MVEEIQPRNDLMETLPQGNGTNHCRSLQPLPWKSACNRPWWGARMASSPHLNSGLTWREELLGPPAAPHLPQLLPMRTRPENAASIRCRGSAMRRKRRGSPARQVEACDVWLDTAKLKQRRGQSLLPKPKVSHRLLERHCEGYTSVPSTQTRAAPACTKQTTISAFFSTQTDEKDKENSRLSPLILNKEHKEKGIPLAASPVKILTFPQIEEAQKPPFRAEDKKVQIIPQHLVQKAPVSQTSLPDSLLEAESRSKGEASCGGEEDFSLDFTQDSEGNQILAHRNVADLFAGETVSGSNITSRKRTDSWINKEEGQLDPEEEKDGLDIQPSHGANQSKKPHRLSSSNNSLIDFSEPENINPAIKRDNIGAAGFCSSPKRIPKAQPLRERSQNAGGGSAKEEWDSKNRLSSPLRQLFTQDSEGNRVISHYCQKVRSPLKAKNSTSSWLTNSPYKDCSRDATNRNVSKLGEHQLDACYDLLFTQDSEGNRVIKH
ncbi:aurora kinase A- and ninein-interacting protein [Dromaius novaehollandiae]|uniref:aurora kinase A- and ninein-interacting protein n=1 Tax=Dromaius novaehollandiae TaxID=8790 RepID=UPI00311D536B